ncbi:MAG: asparagine synthase (glutamine-hydrolyzing), partial [Bacteroidia bacterium]|nr:asparagine synthase (glutamine-hydrolyzing) [Bacteroidia bacterium]
NGEIYNYKEIRAELEVNGHQFIGNSDTEVVLHAFKQWGINGIEKFIGMFAFVVYDSNKREIFCVRDRTGVKPFFYYWKDDLFLFASELKAFHKHPQFKKEINYNSVAAFMQFGNIPSEFCIFNNCFKLKPGHFLKLDLSKKLIEIKQYWSVYNCYNKKAIDISFDEAKNETEKLMHSAFNYRMISDVPVGVFLSGGYDSACLTAILQKNRTEKLKTFTIGVPDIGLNEANDAKAISNYLDTEHFDLTCTQKEAIELIDQLPIIYDEPFADSSAIPTALVSRLAKHYVTVALSADGGDEVFAGYNRYDYLMKHGRILNNIPKPLRMGASNFMSKISSDKIPLLNKKYNFHNRYEKLKGLLKDPSSKNMMLSL